MQPEATEPVLTEPVLTEPVLTEPVPTGPVLIEPVLIERVRRFNRTVTQRIGALDDAYLSRGRPLGQARLLWEIGPDGREVRALRARLRLDSGYLSRLLRALEADGLIEVEPDHGTIGGDRRVRTARLTAAGRAERSILDQGSDELARGILDPLTDRQRERLVTAMAEVERLLAASQVEIAAADPLTPAARHCLQAYVLELAERFDDGFDPALSISADAPELTPPRGVLLVATLHGEPIGCGALKLHVDESIAPNDDIAREGGIVHEGGMAPTDGAALDDSIARERGMAREGAALDESMAPNGGIALDDSIARERGAALDGGIAEVKRMWVSPGARGLGLGRRLLAALESYAARRGVRTLRLETNRNLPEAIALYRSTGYREVAPFNTEPYAHHWFEKPLNQTT